MNEIERKDVMQRQDRERKITDFCAAFLNIIIAADV